jgi:hypothetical protein
MLVSLKEVGKTLGLKIAQNRVLAFVSEQFYEILQMNFADFIPIVRKVPYHFELIDIFNWEHLDKLGRVLRAISSRLTVIRNRHFLLLKTLEFLIHLLLKLLDCLVAVNAKGHDTRRVVCFVEINHCLSGIWLAQSVLVSKPETVNWRLGVRQTKPEISMVPEIAAQ